MAPNANANVRQQYTDTHYQYNRAKLDGVDPLPPSAVRGGIRGLIGLRSNYSRGTDSVAEMAAALRSLAPKHAIGFAVFLEEFSDGETVLLTPAKLQQLKADCVAHSSPELQVRHDLTDTLYLPLHACTTPSGHYI
jgi:hypothetical protein